MLVRFWKDGIITELSTKISRSAVFASGIAGILNFEGAFLHSLYISTSDCGLFFKNYLKKMNKNVITHYLQCCVIWCLLANCVLRKNRVCFQLHEHNSGPTKSTSLQHTPAIIPSTILIILPAQPANHPWEGVNSDRFLSTQLIILRQSNDTFQL